MMANREVPYVNQTNKLRGTNLATETRSAQKPPVNLTDKPRSSSICNSIREV